MGLYAMSAVQTSLSMALNGKNSKAKYIEKPMLMNEMKDPNRELTEEEKKAERQKLLMTLQIMQANFERNKKDKADKEK